MVLRGLSLPLLGGIRSLYALPAPPYEHHPGFVQVFVHGCQEEVVHGLSGGELRMSCGRREGEEELGSRVFPENLTKQLIERGAQGRLLAWARPGTSTASQTHFAFSVLASLGLKHAFVSR